MLNEKTISNLRSIYEPVLENPSPLEDDAIFSPAEKKALADSVVENVRLAIITGRLKPGQRVGEQDLAESMQVSRGPIREALIQLEREGLVLKLRNRGTVVARLSRRDIEEIYSLRRTLEILAIQSFIKNHTPRDLVAMENVLQEMREFDLETLSATQAALVDLQFHELIYRGAHHQRLFDCWETIRSQVLFLLLSRNVANPDFRDMAVLKHTELFDSLKNKNLTGAMNCIEEHFKGSYDRVVHNYLAQHATDGHETASQTWKD